MKLEDIKPGYLCRIPGNQGWCRHGLYRIVAADNRAFVAENGILYAIDTYWGCSLASSLIPGLLKVAEVADKLEFVLDLKTARPTHSAEYETFDAADRAWIPMGGSPEQFYVRADAQPNPVRVRKQLEEKIESERATIRNAISSIAWYRRELDELDAKELASK